MKRTLLSIFSIAAISTQAIAAQPVPGFALNEAREKIVERYISDLKQADYKDITNLFEKNGIVISTSRGRMNAKEFFYAFLPSIESADVQLEQLFVGKTDRDRIAIRFHFTFRLKDGEQGNGEYMDEFAFADGSTKLSAVYMFENSKFE